MQENPFGLGISLLLSFDCPIVMAMGPFGMYLSLGIESQKERRHLMSIVAAVTLS